jgi:alkylation response protein AidB-like acyl-CoA dehydrogenase
MTERSADPATSFGEFLFEGRLRPELLGATAAQDARGDSFLARLEEFLRTRVDPAQIEHDARVPDEVIRGLADLGALGICVPERYGGLGLSKRCYCRAMRLAGSHSAALGTMLSAHQSTGLAQQLMLFGSEQQRRRYLPLVARSEISAFLVTEPEGGSDPASVLTTATPSDDGSAYVLDGVKLWATNGVISDRFAVLAQVPARDGHRGGPSVLIVDGRAEGVRVEFRNEFMGLRGIENGVTRLTGVRVPREDLIGSEGKGLKVALACINHGRLGLSAVCGGASQWALKAAREWAAEREQWGRRIGEHEAIALKLAYIAGMAYAQQAVVDACASLADAGLDIRTEAALTKLFCAEAAWRVADELVQLRGGRGYETAASLAARGEAAIPAEQVLRDLRVFRIFEGTSELMRVALARDAIARRGPAALVAGGPEPEAVGALAPDATLGVHLQFASGAAQLIDRGLSEAAARWGERAQERQGHLGRMVDTAAELFAIACVCMRAHTEQDPERQAASVELADLFCRGARQRVEHLQCHARDAADELDYQAAQHVLEGRYTIAEEGLLDPSRSAQPPAPSADDLRRSPLAHVKP